MLPREYAALCEVIGYPGLLSTHCNRESEGWRPTENIRTVKTEQGKMEG